jgi:hypothetical protein
VTVPKSISVFDRKITIDTAPNLLAFSLNLNRLRHLNDAVRQNADIGVKAQDSLIGI